MLSQSSLKSAPSEQRNAPIGDLIDPAPGERLGLLLVEADKLTEENLVHAKRILSKLDDQRPLLQILYEMDMVTEEDLKDAILGKGADIKIGDLLVELGEIQSSDLNAALHLQAEESGRVEKPRRLGQILIGEHLLDENTFCKVISLQQGLPIYRSEDLAPATDLLNPKMEKSCRELGILPVRLVDGTLMVLMSDPTSQEVKDKAKEFFGRRAMYGVTTERDIGDAYDRIERVRNNGSAVIDESTAAGIVDRMIEDAISRDASDIHIEPMTDKLRVRFRLDGVLSQYSEYPLAAAPAIISRLKIMAGADIADRRRHQDGRVNFRRPSSGEEIDLRASFYVSIHGEKSVLRIMSRKQEYLRLDKIGMAPKMLERFKDNALDSPSGVLIITGPTGSGKTTTLYSCLDYLNNPTTSIITAEDPVEYVMEGITQCTINPKIGLTFEETLRHILRQDPDVVVLGEIRDTFSASTAIQAALTGHKVLTTFHTEDSIGGLLRLLNMEIEAFLISSTVLCVVAQRLLRKICPSCSQPHSPTPMEIRRAGIPAADLPNCEFRKGTGCKRCNFTGYRGRVGVYELLVLDEMIKEAVLNRKTAHEIRRISVENSGLVTMLEDGIAKATMGQTTLQEVTRMLPKLSDPRPVDDIRRLLGYKS